MSKIRGRRAFASLNFKGQTMNRELPPKLRTLPSSAQWLGFAGLAPQILLAVIAIASPARFGPGARAAALVYSGTILSFIGGAWWGLASRPQANVHRIIWLAAVIPSLVAFASIGTLVIGLPFRAGLLLTGTSLIVSLGVDYKLAGSGVSPPGWLRLRVPLSLGLGGLTLLIAILS